jgi:cold shock CspA family protein
MWMELTSTRSDARRIEQRKGNDFQCRGRVADQDVTFQVHQDDNGHVHFENVEVFVHPAEVANRIAKELTERTGVPVEVDCGHGQFVARSVGATFACEASTGENETATVTVTVKDNGKISWTV